MTSSKRTHKIEKLARIYDAEILPVWSLRFGRMLLRGLDIAPGSQILDVACGTGYPAVEIVRRMGEGSRLIAIDGSSAMLDVARKKIEKLGYKGVFFRTESVRPRLSFADDVYDLVVCNLGLDEVADPARAIAEFARVTKPGGQVRCTLPLLGTFEEFYDIYREVLIKHDKHEALAELTRHVEAYPTPADCARWLDGARLVDARVEVEEFSLLFKSSREFFFAPVIEYGPLAAWKRIAGKGQQMQDVFWYIKEAIDAYFLGRAFQITVKAGLLVGRRREADEEDDDVTGRLPQPPVEAVSPAALAAASARTATGTKTVRTTDGTAELDIDELEEIGDIGGAGDPGRGDDAIVADDVELDAFVEGRERPPHLSPPHLLGTAGDAPPDRAGGDDAPGQDAPADALPAEALPGDALPGHHAQDDDAHGDGAPAVGEPPVDPAARPDAGD